MPRKNNTPPHLPLRFVNACEQKRRFRTEKEAASAAEHQMLLKPDLELSVYQCELCGGWHLTRNQSRNQ
jgi:hypothetical protein